MDCFNLLIRLPSEPYHTDVEHIRRPERSETGGREDLGVFP
jgi:hypothetical protein